MKLHVSGDRMVSLPGHTKPEVKIHWYVVNQGNMDVQKLIASLSGMSKRGMGTWSMPPISWMCTHGRVMERAFFADLWAVLSSEREHMLRGRVDWREFAHNMEQTKRIIPYAPHNWLRRVFAISKAWSAPLDRRGCFIYACISVQTSKVYVGQTGCRTGQRALAKRFREHLAGAALMAQGKSYKRFRQEEPEVFYDGMKKIGRHEFIIVPLEYVRPRQADIKEIRWIRKWGKNVYNVQHTRWRTGKKWHSLKAEPLPRHALTTDEVKRLIHQQLNRPRRGQSTEDLLQLWLAASRVPKSLKQRLGNRLREVAKARLKLNLPARIPIPYPVHNTVDLTHMRRTVQDIIQHLDPNPQADSGVLADSGVFCGTQTAPSGTDTVHTRDHTYQGAIAHTSMRAVYVCVIAEHATTGERMCGSQSRT